MPPPTPFGERGGTDTCKDRVLGRIAVAGGVAVKSRGVRHGSAEVLARLGRGEDVDPSEYTFRTATQIETAAPEPMAEQGRVHRRRRTPGHGA